MAHRGTASSKKADASAPAFASVTAADIIRAPVTQKSIPLDLASLIVPYKKQGRLTLRVERMPQRAKLSAGRNNGDGTWSLASDELEDLNYLVPSNISGGHELSLRIMSFDNGAAHTLKVVPLAIPAWDGDADVTAAENIVRSAAETHDPILHNELSKMQSLFAVRDSDLAELRAALKQANAQKEAELAAARTAWEEELKQRLAEAAAQAKAETEKERQTWQNKQQGQTDKAEALILEKVSQELNRSKSGADERLEAERKHWQAQIEQKVAEERDRLKAEADIQFDAERRQWELQADRKIAEERSRIKAESDLQLETERGQWHVEAQQRIAQEFCRSKTETDQQFETERKQLQARAEQKVAEERDRLKAEADLRFDAERELWQTQIEQRLADERSRTLAELEQKIAQERARAKAEADQRVEAERQLWQTQANSSGEAERHRLLAEASERLAAEQKRWLDQAEERLAAERGRWQSESDQRLEAERQNWTSSSQAAAAQAEARWKTEETVRAAAALAEWQQQSARQLTAEGDKCRKLEAALAAALAQPASAPLAETDAETGRLRQELTALQSVLPERDRAIVQLRDEVNQQRARQEAETTQAAQVWKAEETVRTAAVVEQARAQSQDAIAAATARAENAERALAEAQGAAPAADTPRWDDAYVDGLRRDISTLRTALVSREVELGHARAALDQARVHQVVARPGNAPIRRFAGPDDSPQETAVAKPSFFRDFAVIAGVLVPLIVIYPYVAAYLPVGMQSGISTVTGGLLSARVESTVAPRPAPPPAPVAPRLTTNVTRAANVRATPATTGALLVTLPRDSAVVVLKTDGNWTQVELSGKAGTKPQQGWVFSSYLKSAVPNTQVKPAIAPTIASVAAKPVTPAPKPTSTSTIVEPERAKTAADTSGNANVTAAPENASPVAPAN